MVKEEMLFKEIVDARTMDDGHQAIRTAHPEHSSVDVSLKGHSDTCKMPIQICIACMRNSSSNSIYCHSCNGKITPYIGCECGALFVAGNDTVNNTIAQAMTDDVNRFAHVITSRRLSAIWMKKEMVEKVCPTVPGKPEKMKQNLINAVKSLKTNGGENLQTLLFLFSGHHGKNGYVLGDTNETITRTELESLLKTLSPHVKRFLVFLDCCDGETLKALGDDGSILVQLNACQENEESTIRSKDGSVFTNILIKALTKRKCSREYHKALNKDTCAITGDFITIQTLYSYVKRHMTDLGVTPYYSISKGTIENELVAYNYTYNCKIDFTWMAPLSIPLRVSISLAECKNFAELKQQLLQALVAETDGDTLNDCEEVWSHDSLVNIEARTGPKPKHKKVINDTEELDAAWYDELKFYVNFGSLEDLGTRPVGLFLPTRSLAQSFHSLFEPASQLEGTQMTKRINKDNIKMCKQSFKQLMSRVLTEEKSNIVLQEKLLRQDVDCKRFVTDGLDEIIYALSNTISNNTQVDVVFPRCEGIAVCTNLVCFKPV